MSPSKSEHPDGSSDHLCSGSPVPNPLPPGPGRLARIACGTPFQMWRSSCVVTRRYMIDSSLREAPRRWPRRFRIGRRGSTRKLAALAAMGGRAGRRHAPAGSDYLPGALASDLNTTSKPLTATSLDRQPECVRTGPDTRWSNLYVGRSAHREPG